MIRRITLFVFIILSTCSFSQLVWKRIPTPADGNIRALGCFDGGNIFVQTASYNGSEEISSLTVFKASDFGRTWDTCLTTTLVEVPLFYKKVPHSTGFVSDSIWYYRSINTDLDMYRADPILTVYSNKNILSSTSLPGGGVGIWDPPVPDVFFAGQQPLYALLKDRSWLVGIRGNFLDSSGLLWVRVNPQNGDYFANREDSAGPFTTFYRRSNNTLTRRAVLCVDQPLHVKDSLWVSSSAISKDNGISWTEQLTPLDNFLINKEGVGYSYNADMIYRTTDYGKTWEIQSSAPISMRELWIADSSVYITDGSELYRGGDSSIVLNVKASNRSRSATIKPNPVLSATCLIELPTAESGELTVTDMVGRIVQTINVADTTDELSLNISGLPPGVYVVSFGEYRQQLLRR